jgi:hypothetical protein
MEDRERLREESESECRERRWWGHLPQSHQIEKLVAMVVVAVMAVVAVVVVVGMEGKMVTFKEDVQEGWDGPHTCYIGVAT